MSNAVTNNEINGCHGCSGRVPERGHILRKQWRRLQRLANELWTSWIKKVHATLQARHRWNRIKRKVKVGDTVLLREENKW